MSISYLIAALGVVAVFCSLSSVYSSRSHTAEGLAMLQDTVSSIEERIPSPKKGWQHYYRYLNKSYKMQKRPACLVRFRSASLLSPMGQSRMWKRWKI